jgi:hypothetical protein
MDIGEIVAGIASSDALKSVAAKAGIAPGQASNALQGILEHVQTGGAPDLGALGDIAAKAGLGPAQIQAFLPSILGLVSGHAQNANEGVQAVLGGLVGSLEKGGLGGLLSGLDADRDGSVLDDAAGMLGGLFGKK